MKPNQTKNLIERNGIFYFVRQAEGKITYKSLKTRVHAVALKKLAAEQAKIELGIESPAAPKAPDYPTLAEVARVYEAAYLIRNQGTKTPRGNLAALRAILQDAGHDTETCRIDCITPTAAAAWVERALSGSSDPVTHERRKRSIKSSIIHAKAVFTPWALERYRAEGWSIPESARDFAAWSPTFKIQKIRYRRPPEELITRTIQAGRALQATTPDLAPVFMLAYDLGMRAAEIAAATPDWIEQNPFGGHTMNICSRKDFQPKHGHERQIPIAPDILAALRADLQQRPRPHLIPGATQNSRYNLITRTLSDWMRATGWSAETYPKAAHELRKLAGCRWFTLLGPAVAQKLLGHESLTTTQDFYCEYSAPISALPTDYGGSIISQDIFANSRK